MPIPVCYRSTIHSDFMQQGRITWDLLRSMVQNPKVYPYKEAVPVALYGSMADHLFMNDYGQPRPMGVNIKELYAIQLDYDDGKSIDWFVSKFGEDFKFLLYTSYSYGYKPAVNGVFDRFRVIIPLATPLDCKNLGCYFKRAMQSVFDCDPSCWDRGHMQCIPAIRDKGAPYRYYINDKCDKLFTIDWNIVQHEENKAVAAYTFNLALNNWYAYCDNLLGRTRHEPDEEEIRQRALTWAQEQFDQCPVGSRNNTMFSVLSWLKSKGVTGDQAFMLTPPVGIHDEFDRMVERIFCN